MPRVWEGETAFLLGGGSSLAKFDASLLEGRRVIGINEAGLSLAPWCEVLYWADGRWLEWNVDRLGLHTGRWKVSRQNPQQRTKDCDRETAGKVEDAIARFGILHLPHEKKAALSDDPGRTAGACTGGSAINLAYLLGARRIVLLGYDMRPGHFHDRHRRPSKPESYVGRFIPTIRRMAPSLAARGVEVLNCTPGSALDCFPTSGLEAVL